MFSKLKQYKDMAKQAKEMQGKLAQETANVEAAGGRIRMVIDGNQEILACDIDTSLIAPEKKEELEKAVREAANDAIKKSQRLMADSMKRSGLGLPGMS
jgi:DNA-binding YbaB/EbfC family protein